MDHSTAQAATLTTGQWMLLLGAIILVIQFLYRLWDKKDNKEILESINNAVSKFDPHLERTKKTKALVQEIHHMHEAKDEDGRPLIYLPKELLETQREIVKMSHTIATTQKHMARLFEKFEETIRMNTERLESAIILHSDSCKNQFHELDKKLKD